MVAFAGQNCYAQTHAKGEIVTFPFGDMNQWVVREIKESSVIGGNTNWPNLV